MRSKTLLVSNILATLYSGVLFWIFGGMFITLIEIAGTEFIDFFVAYFELVFDLFELLGMSSELTFIYVFIALFLIHIVVFPLGCVIAWISYIAKKSGGAKFAATLYLIGTICFPIYLIFGLPITIIGFIGSGKQKKINKINIAI